MGDTRDRFADQCDNVVSPEHSHTERFPWQFPPNEHGTRFRIAGGDVFAINGGLICKTSPQYARMIHWILERTALRHDATGGTL